MTQSYQRLIQIVAKEVWTAPMNILVPASGDPFRGGCRSKGEKKRAARQRRVRGGY